MGVKVAPTSLNQAISAVASLETLPSRATLPLASMTQMLILPKTHYSRIIIHGRSWMMLGADNASLREVDPIILRDDHLPSAYQDGRTPTRYLI